MRHANRGAAALLAALLSLALVLPTAATEPPTTLRSPSNDLKVAAIDPFSGEPGVVTDGPLYLGVFHDFVVYGSGYGSSVVVTLTFQQGGETVSFDVQTDAAGSFEEDFYISTDDPSVASEWLLTAGGDSVELISGGGFPLFLDSYQHPFELEIYWLFFSGITRGCNFGNAFCPNAVVTREQMASFLVRALSLPATSTDFFTDDESTLHEADINRLAASGITTGCTATLFCPFNPVTRQEMASFLVRAFHLAPSGTDRFTDDETSIHEADINSLAASGITTGCTASLFCPTAGVTRAQMAAFLYRKLCCDPHGIPQ